MASWLGKVMVHYRPGRVFAEIVIGSAKGGERRLSWH
jgi:hypothetical protein